MAGLYLASAQLFGLRDRDGADEDLVQCLLPHVHAAIPFPKP